ncbi:hypothetical protein ACRAWD_14350 [Caulobacter segnis]
MRGQIAWLIPQPELRYGLYYRNVSVLPRARRDRVPAGRRQRGLRLQRRSRGSGHGRGQDRGLDHRRAYYARMAARPA